jgi:hypothetical protein
MTGVGRRPEGADPNARLRALPLAIWPDWSIRLRPPTIEPDTFRIGAAIALCVPGSTQPIGTIYGHWPGAQYSQRMVKFGRLVTADPHGTAILATLCAIADMLDRDGAPINYEHRRELAGQIELLDSDTWTMMCRAGGIPAGGDRKLTHARLRLWETLTGGLPRQAPTALRLDYREFLAHHSTFALHLPTPTARRLNEHARRLLNTHGCQNEPLTWSPPTDGIALDQLPGPDPDTIDPMRVHAAIARQQTATQAAAELGITLEHLRYLARKHPADTQNPSVPITSPRVRFAALLGAEQLRELIGRGNSLRQIEARYGISRKTLHDELVAHGIPIPPRARQRHAAKHDG